MLIMNERLLEEIEYINDIELDILWTLLKRKDLGISRKLICMGHVLEISEKTILKQAATDEEGRVLDKVNRMCIHDALIKHE